MSANALGRIAEQDDGVNPVIEELLRKQNCGRIPDDAAAVVPASLRYAAAHVGRTTAVSFIVGR